MKVLYTVIFRDYHDIERTNSYYTEISGGVFGYKLSKQLYFENKDDLIKFLRKWWPIYNRGWFEETKIEQFIKEIQTKLDGLGKHYSIFSAPQFGCEISIVLIPTIDQILNSPLLDGKMILETSSDEQ